MNAASSTDSTAKLGARYLGDRRCSFRVWAPEVNRVTVQWCNLEDRPCQLTKDNHGYHHGTFEGVKAGDRYFFCLDDGPARPDPASRFQPEGVHQASAIVDPSFDWTDQDWKGLPLSEYILYELHVGTFSPEGAFDAVIPHLARLKELGITALELMPVAQFPGQRNWGYDGVCPFAMQNSYGGPEGLQRLVNAAHQAGMAVVLDVVYNHLGPEGNYLGEYGPYFTDLYKTPWGKALNFDGPESDHVRRFFIENALFWQTEFHIDALRLDAVHAIRDFSPVPFLEELGQACHKQARQVGRKFYLIAESDMNMARHILPRSKGGYGLDAQWSDDFYRTVLAYRTSVLDLANMDKGDLQVRFWESERLLFMQYQSESTAAWIVYCFADNPMDLDLPIPAGPWHKQLDSAGTAWKGPGSVLPATLEGGQPTRLRFHPWSVALFDKTEPN